MSPYTVNTEQQDKGPGHWSYTVVTVQEWGKKIGEYTRNYHAYAEQTFCPVKYGDHWYALYSKDYQAINVMTLPDCKDITVRSDEDGKAIKGGYGFCPVEIYVPYYRKYTWFDTLDFKHIKHEESREDGKKYEVWRSEKCDPFQKERVQNYFPGDEESDYLKGKGGTLSDWMSADFGFVAGCVWGDDSSWKIQYLDLKRVTKGIVINEPRFGYRHLPEDRKLKEAIDHGCWDEDFDGVQLIHATWFDRETGEEL